MTGRRRVPVKMVVKAEVEIEVEVVPCGVSVGVAEVKPKAIDIQGETVIEEVQTFIPSTQREQSPN